MGNILKAIENMPKKANKRNVSKNKCKLKSTIPRRRVTSFWSVPS